MTASGHSFCSQNGQQRSFIGLSQNDKVYLITEMAVAKETGIPIFLRATIMRFMICESFGY